MILTKFLIKLSKRLENLTKVMTLITHMCTDYSFTAAVPSGLMLTPSLPIMRPR